MKFEEVLPDVRNGKTAHSEALGWNVSIMHIFNDGCFRACLEIADWEIVETPDEKLQRERMEWLERVIAECFKSMREPPEGFWWVYNVRNKAKDTK